MKKYRSFQWMSDPFKNVVIRTLYAHLQLNWTSPLSSWLSARGQENNYLDIKCYWSLQPQVGPNGYRGTLCTLWRQLFAVAAVYSSLNYFMSSCHALKCKFGLALFGIFVVNILFVLQAVFVLQSYAFVIREWWFELFLNWFWSLALKYLHLKWSTHIPRSTTWFIPLNIHVGVLVA